MSEKMRANHVRRSCSLVHDGIGLVCGQIAPDKLGGVVAVCGDVVWVIPCAPSAEAGLQDHHPHLEGRRGTSALPGAWTCLHSPSRAREGVPHLDVAAGFVVLLLRKVHRGEKGPPARNSHNRPPLLQKTIGREGEGQPIKGTEPEMLRPSPPIPFLLFSHVFPALYAWFTLHTPSLSHSSAPLPSLQGLIPDSIVRSLHGGLLKSACGCCLSGRPAPASRQHSGAGASPAPSSRRGFRLAPPSFLRSTQRPLATGTHSTRTQQGSPATQRQGGVSVSRGENRNATSSFN